MAVEAKVENVMSGNVFVCTPTSHINDVARIMRDEDCGCLPVVDEQNREQVVGMITDRDIVCRVVADDKDPRHEIVRHVMSKHVVSVTLESDLEECRRLMRDHQLRRIPVLGSDNRLVGIVAAADIARALPAKSVGEMLENISIPH